MQGECDVEARESDNKVSVALEQEKVTVTSASGCLIFHGSSQFRRLLHRASISSVILHKASRIESIRSVGG